MDNNKPQGEIKAEPTGQEHTPSTIGQSTLMPPTPKPNEDLWAALLNMISPGKKAIVQKKLDKAEAKSLNAEYKRIKPSWRDEEVILIIHEATCTTCLSRFQWPNQWLLIKKSHEVLGTHYAQHDFSNRIDPELEFAHLPLRTEYQLCEVHACQHCFGLSNLLVKAAKEHQS